MSRKTKPNPSKHSERPSARRPTGAKTAVPVVPPQVVVPPVAHAADEKADVRVNASRLGARAGARRVSSAVPVKTTAKTVAPVAANKPSKNPKAENPKKAPTALPAVANANESVVESLPLGASTNDTADSIHPSVQDQLQDIEARLDALLDDVQHADSDAQARRRAAEAIGHIAARLDVGQNMEAFEGTTLLTSARELLSTDYYLRQWGRIGMRNRSEQVDDFGLDPTYEARVRPLFELMYQRYFRVETDGIENIPASGRALLIGNHSGTIPLDGVMLKTAIGMHHSARREMRWLAEDFVFHFPFLGAFMNRIGAVRACQENAQRLLGQDSLLAVFPEGIQGIGKLYRDRYRLQRFGRGGYIKLALRTGTPIIPVAIVGAEETYPLLLKLTKLAKPLGVPFVPVTPLFPLLGPVGLLPLPSRWRIRVGAPLEELSEYGPKDAEDPIVVNRLNERVRNAIQEMLAAALQERGEHAFMATS